MGEGNRIRIDRQLLFPNSLGLLSMRERARVFGGELGPYVVS